MSLWDLVFVYELSVHILGNSPSIFSMHCLTPASAGSIIRSLSYQTFQPGFQAQLGLALCREECPHVPASEATQPTSPLQGQSEAGRWKMCGQKAGKGAAGGTARCLAALGICFFCHALRNKTSVTEAWCPSQSHIWAFSNHWKYSGGTLCWPESKWKAPTPLHTHTLIDPPTPTLALTNKTHFSSSGSDLGRAPDTSPGIHSQVLFLQA